MPGRFSCKARCLPRWRWPVRRGPRPGHRAPGRGGAQVVPFRFAHGHRLAQPGTGRAWPRRCGPAAGAVGPSPRSEPGGMRRGRNLAANTSQANPWREQAEQRAGEGFRQGGVARASLRFGAGDASVRDGARAVTVDRNRDLPNGTEELALRELASLERVLTLSASSRRLARSLADRSRRARCSPCSSRTTIPPSRFRFTT